MIYLRQSTASQEVTLGHFVDDTDGKTAETALTIANTDIKVWKTGATTLANKNSGGATHISGGIYYTVLDATDTDTIGPLTLFVAVSGALAVKVSCVVLDEAVFDQMFGTSAFATAGAIADAVWEEAIADHTGTAGSTAEALDAAGGGVTAAAIADAVWDEATAGHTTAGTFGKQLKDQVDAILVDTGTTLDGKIDVIDANVDAVLVDTGTTLDGKLDVIDANVDAILVDTAEIGIAGAGLTNITVAALGATAKGHVNAEVVDALNVDTYAEPGQGDPPATATLVQKIGYLFKQWRNKKTQTSSEYKLYADNGTTVDQKATVSDDGTTATKTEMATGA